MVTISEIAGTLLLAALLCKRLTPQRAFEGKYPSVTEFWPMFFSFRNKLADVVYIWVSSGSMFDSPPEQVHVLCGTAWVFAHVFFIGFPLACMRPQPWTGAGVGAKTCSKTNMRQNSGAM